MRLTASCREYIKGALTPFCAFSFSFFHISMTAFRPSSQAFVVSNVFKLSMSICITLRSRPFRSRSFIVSANFWSMFLVKVWPGLSAKMRISIMALYWYDGRVQ